MAGMRTETRERCWWCGDETDLELRPLSGALLDGVLMKPPASLGTLEAAEVRLCYGCLERFAAFVDRADEEYRAHLLVRSGDRPVFDVPPSVGDLIRRIYGGGRGPGPHAAPF